MSSNVDRQKSFRARKLEAGETEIRGVYAKTEMHPEIKDKLKKQIKKMVRDNDLQKH